MHFIGYCGIVVAFIGHRGGMRVARSVGSDGSAYGNYGDTKLNSTTRRRAHVVAAGIIRGLRNMASSYEPSCRPWKKRSRHTRLCTASAKSCDLARLLYSVPTIRAFAADTTTTRPPLVGPCSVKASSVPQSGILPVAGDSTPTTQSPLVGPCSVKASSVPWSVPYRQFAMSHPSA